MGKLIKFPTTFNGGFQGKVENTDNSYIEDRKTMELTSMKCITFLNSISNQINLKPNHYEIAIIVRSPQSSVVYTTVEENSNEVLKQMINTAKEMVEKE